MITFLIICSFYGYIIQTLFFLILYFINHISLFCIYDADFERDCTSLYSHWQRMRVHLSPQSHQNLLSVILLYFAFLIGVKWNLKVVLILIVYPQWLRMVNFFWVIFLDIFISSGETSLFRYLTHLKKMIHFFLDLFLFAICVFWIRIQYLCQMYSWQILWIASSLDLLYSWLCRSFHSMRSHLSIVLFLSNHSAIQKDS